ncbi:MAG TPA: hypothetical protein VN426_10420 [Syntrophomonadaceae bacterium]|nr:hypothetical protein [Syntrophomonadaceae bacterium]
MSLRNYGLFVDLVKHSNGEDAFSLMDVLSDHLSPRQRAESAKQLVADGFIELIQLNANDTSVAIKGTFTEKGLEKIEAGNLRQNK